MPLHILKTNRRSPPFCGKTKILGLLPKRAKKWPNPAPSGADINSTYAPFDRVKPQSVTPLVSIMIASWISARPKMACARKVAAQRGIQLAEMAAPRVFGETRGRKSAAQS